MLNPALYTPSSRVLASLAGASAPAAAPAPFAAPSVAEPRVTPLRRNFLQGRGFAASSAAEGGAGGGIALYSPSFYAACTVGGILSCGLTHMGVTPLDVVKCNMQARGEEQRAESGGGAVCAAGHPRRRPRRRLRRTGSRASRAASR